LTGGQFGGIIELLNRISLVSVWRAQQRRLARRRTPGVGARPAGFQTRTSLERIGQRCFPSDDAQLSRLHEEGYPFVLHGHLPDCTISFVDLVNVGGAHKTVSHLIGLGHRCIGLITNAPLSYAAAQDRLTGYRQALALMMTFSLLTFLPF
jgi:hypothetical protein